MRRLALLLVLCIDACRTPTAMTVRIVTDVPCSAQRGVAITAASPAEYETAPPTGRSTRCTPLGNGLYDTGRIVITPPDDGSDRIALKAVLGVSRNAESCTAGNYGGCIVDRRLLRYLPHTELELELLLRQECEGVACGPDTTCLARVCRPAEIDPERCKDGCGNEVLGMSCSTPGRVECTGGKRVTCLPNSTLQVENCGLACSATSCVAATKTLAVGANAEPGGGGTSFALVAGDVYAWGSNIFGRAGVTGVDPATPTRLTTLPKIADIEAGGTATQVFARDESGGVWCWGLAASGQCGAPETSSVLPRRVLDDKGAALTGIQRISTGSVFGCMINAAGDVLCMGEDGVAQLGRGTIGGRSAQPLSVDRSGWSGRALDISCMTNSCCLIDDTGAVACWGNNDLGQTGTGRTEKQVLVPTRVALPRAARSLRAGDQAICTILDDASVTCWGNGARRLFNSADLSPRLTPVALTALAGKDVLGLAVAMPRGHFAWTKSGAVLGWGSDGLRVGEVDNVPELTGATSISIAADHGCAVIAGGVQCWGGNKTGQLGDGSAGHPTPAPVIWK